MARGTLTAPVHPSARIADLAGKGAQRTPQQTAELIDLLAKRVAYLEARLDEFTP